MPVIKTSPVLQESGADEVLLLDDFVILSGAVFQA
jgi:hypothetical protein